MKIILETTDGFRKYMEIPEFRPSIQTQNHKGLRVPIRMNNNTPPTTTEFHTISFYATNEYEGEALIYKQQ